MSVFRGDLAPDVLYPLVSVSVLLMAEFLYLLSLWPTIGLAGPGEATRAAVWTFLAIAAIHWWWGAYCYLVHVDTVRSLLDAYWLFAILALAAAPALDLERLDRFYFLTAAAFMLLHAKYLHSLGRVADARVRRYGRRKAALELAIGLGLAASGLVARGLSGAEAAVLAWLTVAGEVAVIALMGLFVYPLLPAAQEGRP